MENNKLTPGRKAKGDSKRIQITFYIEKYVEDKLGKEFCKTFCQEKMYEEYNKRTGKGIN